MKHSRFHDLLDASPEIRTAVLEAVGGYLRRLDEEAPIYDPTMLEEIDA